ncbi:peptidoglycan-binding domain-containing protein [Nitrobacteraceae bacterium UC4446_H13]
MPKATTADGGASRRRRRSTEVDAKRKPKAERGMMMRVLLHSPKDTFAAALALAAVIAIVVNALFLQAGHHPSPMFGKSVAVPLAAPSETAALLSASPLPRPRPAEATISRAEAAAIDSGPAETTKSIDAPHPAKPVAAARAPIVKQAAAHPAVAHHDPLGDLIVSTRRTANVQRALTKYGYGQLKPTGNVGSDTQAAIQKFERERKLPVTGKVSDRLVRELSAVTGQAID